MSKEKKGWNGGQSLTGNCLILKVRKESRFIAMKASEIFGIVVRLTGFFITIWGLYQVQAGVVTALENVGLLPREAGEQYSALSYYSMGMPPLIFGVLLFLFADQVVKLTYRDR